MKTIKNVYLFRETHLPIDGWLQGCFNCYIITSHAFLFKTINNKKNNKIYEFHCYTCNNCQKKLRTDDTILLKFSEKANKYIKKNYNNLFEY